MAEADPKMQAFQGLSYREKWRVTRFLARGEAPRDPRLAVAAIELAENYPSQGSARAIFTRWLPILVVLIGGVAAILFAVDGDALAAIFTALIVLVNVGHLTLNPMTRPQNVTRSLAASRRVIASKS